MYSNQRLPCIWPFSVLHHFVILSFHESVEISRKVQKEWIGKIDFNSVECDVSCSDSRWMMFSLLQRCGIEIDVITERNIIKNYKINMSWKGILWSFKNMLVPCIHPASCPHHLKTIPHCPQTIIIGNITYVNQSRLITLCTLFKPPLNLLGSNENIPVSPV